jgi:hypothetical protein
MYGNTTAPTTFVRIAAATKPARNAEPFCMLAFSVSMTVVRIVVEINVASKRAPLSGAIEVNAQAVNVARIAPATEATAANPKPSFTAFVKKGSDSSYIGLLRGFKLCTEPFDDIGTPFNKVILMYKI